MSPEEEELLLPRDILLTSGIHIGTRTKDRSMRDFIFKIRSDGLAILDVKKIDERIRVAARFLSRFVPSAIAVVCAREYGWEPVQKFCDVVGAIPITGRFVPGSLSNPSLPSHIEPEVALVVDPEVDFQVITEAALMGIPVVALCSTNNNSYNVDLVVPVNNKGRRSLATIFWLLARETMRERGEIGRDEDIPLSIDDFEMKIEKEAEEE